MNSTQEKVISLLNTFFQEYMNYLFTKKHGKDWFDQELLPYIKKVTEENSPENERNIDKYKAFLKKTSGSLRKEDMDVTLCCAVLLFEERYDFGLDSEIIDSLHELRIVRNEYDHSTNPDEFTQMHLNSKAIVHIQRLTSMIGEDVFSVTLFSQLEEVKGTVLNENTSNPANAIPEKHKTVDQQAFDDAESYCMKEDYKTAFSLHLELAELMFVPSMIRLGEFYQFGFGREVHLEKAIEWYETAEKILPGSAGDRIEKIHVFQQGLSQAQKGHALSCFRIGSVYEEGTIVVKNMGQAIEWYENALDQGCLIAKNRLIALANKKNIDVMYLIAGRLESGKGFDQNNDKAVEMYQRILETDSNQSKALELIRSIADRGNSSVLHLLGSFYKLGRFVEKNMDKAVTYYESAANAGYIPSQLDLGSMYYSGNNVTQNYEQAYHWFEMAAKANDNQAQYYMGRMLSQGWGVQKDELLAYQWYSLSAAQGNKWAQNNLAIMYINGTGVEKNIQEALKWYNEAASQGEAISVINLANLYHNGTQVTKDYTQALKWFLKGVENGFSESYVFFNIGKYYDEGLGVEQDVKESVLWYQKAADLGHKDAQYRLGRLLLEGNSVDCNEKKAFEYFEKAAAQNHDESTMQLGLCYFKGLGVKRDYQKAFAIFKDMRDNKDAKAILGYMYNFGLGIEKDYINAVFYYNQAKYDNEMAMVNLAHLKCLGYGTKQDQYDAKTLYEYAANKGNPIGLYYLGLFYENGIQTYVQYEKAKECYQKAAEKGHKKAKTALDNIIREHFSSQLLPEIPDSYLTDMMEP